MKIAFDARLFGITNRGIGMYTEKLLNALKVCDQTNFYYLLGEERINYLTSTNWQTVKISWPVYSWREQILLPPLLNKLKPDLIHYPHFNVPFLNTKPFIVTVHDLILHQFPNERATTLPRWYYHLKLVAYYKVVKRALTKALAIITVSHSAKEDIIKYYPSIAKKIKVIYEAPALLPATITEPVGPPLIPEDYYLYVGAAYPHKNLFFLLSGFNQSKINNLKLVLVGRHDYFYQQLIREARKNKLTNQVIFWGEASQASLANLYFYSKGYITPSLAEGFDLGAVQAAFFHKPILASDIKVHQEILKETAMFFPAQDLTGLVSQLEQFYFKPRLVNYEQLDTKLTTDFNWLKNAQATLQLYQNLNL